MSFSIYGHDHFMKKAYQQALQAFDENEVPVGAVVVCEHQIIGSGYNQTEKLNDVSAHAEMIAITAAAQYLGSKYLKDCTLYVTLEPCAMCAGLIHWAQIDRLVIGASDKKKGFRLYEPSLLLPKVEIIDGVMENDCTVLLREFFNARRG